MCVPDPYDLPTIHFTGGATQELEFSCYFFMRRDPFNLDHCYAEFSFVDYLDQESDPVVKVMEISQSHTEAGVRNILRAVLAPGDTMNISGKFVYQISIRDDEGNVEPPSKGIMYIHNNINKKFLKSNTN